MSSDSKSMKQTRHCLELTKVVAIESGNSAAIMAKAAVRKAALPRASTMRTAKLRPMKVLVSLM